MSRILKVNKETIVFRGVEFGLPISGWIQYRSSADSVYPLRIGGYGAIPKLNPYSTFASSIPGSSNIDFWFRFPTFLIGFPIELFLSNSTALTHPHLRRVTTDNRRREHAEEHFQACELFHVFVIGMWQLNADWLDCGYIFSH